MSYHVERIEKVHAEIKGVISLYGVTSYELEFMRSAINQTSLSEKQENVLSQIERKVFRAAD